MNNSHSRRAVWRHAAISLARVSCMLLLLAGEGQACLNTYTNNSTYGTDAHGNRTKSSWSFDELANELRSVRLDRELWQQRASELSIGLETAEFKQQSDYAVALIYLGEYQEAIEILKGVEEEQPGEYLVAANLGTAYELAGDVAEALKWITIGYERNQESHHGSEWVHVKILEAKVKMAEDPDWLKSNTVLGIDFGSAEKPYASEHVIVDELGISHELVDVADAVKSQLFERLKFVTAPDPIVADLLFDLANLIALNSVVERAIPIYKLAGEFGVENESLLAQRIDYHQNLVSSNLLSGFPAFSLDTITVLNSVMVLALAGIACCIFLSFKRGIQSWLTTLQAKQRVS